MMRFIVALSLALVPVAASAAPAAGAQKAADMVVQPKGQEGVRVYDFPDDDIQGAGVGLVLTEVGARPRGQRDSLIKVRTHFIPQMLKMAIDV